MDGAVSTEPSSSTVAATTAKLTLPQARARGRETAGETSAPRRRRHQARAAPPSARTHISAAPATAARTNRWPVHHGAATSVCSSIARSLRWMRSEEHTSELQSRGHLVCRLLLEKKKKSNIAQSASTQMTVQAP